MDKVYLSIEPSTRYEEGSYEEKGLYQVRLGIGVQSFTFDYHAPLENATWYAEMLTKAFSNLGIDLERVE